MTYLAQELFRQERETFPAGMMDLCIPTKDAYLVSMMAGDLMKMQGIALEVSGWRHFDENMRNDFPKWVNEEIPATVATWIKSDMRLRDLLSKINRVTVEDLQIIQRALWVSIYSIQGQAAPSLTRDPVSMDWPLSREEMRNPWLNLCWKPAEHPKYASWWNADLGRATKSETRSTIRIMREPREIKIPIHRWLPIFERITVFGTIEQVMTLIYDFYQSRFPIGRMPENEGLGVYAFRFESMDYDTMAVGS